MLILFLPHQFKKKIAIALYAKQQAIDFQKSLV